MNKKLVCAGLAMFLLAGCTSSSSDSSSNSGNAGEVTTTATVTGSDDSETTATVTKTDGKITGISVDVVTAEGASKLEGSKDGSYDMTKASPIGKNWDEQVSFLENYLIENGLDSVKVNADGYAEEEDVLAGCTINIADIMEAIDTAANK